VAVTPAGQRPNPCFRFSDDVERRNYNVSATGVVGRFCVAFEVLPLLKDLDGLIVDCSSEMIIGRIVADFHAAIGDFVLEFRITGQRGGELGDRPMPIRFRPVGEPIPDHKMLHGLLPVQHTDDSRCCLLEARLDVR